MTLCLLLGSAVELAGDIRHERCTVLSVSEALHQHYQHKWPGRKNDPGIMVSLAHLAGLVRHARACGKPGGNAVIEALTLEDFDHMPGGLLIHGLPRSDRVEELEKPTSGRGVIQALFERLVVLDAAQDIHAVRTQGMNRGADIVDAELFEQEICCEGAADRDHELAKLCQRARLSNSLVQIRFRVITGIERVDRAIHQTTKFVLHPERIVECQLSLLPLVEKL